MKRILALLLIITLMFAIAGNAFAALQKGSKGVDVVELQKRLIEFGYLDGEADGDFGKKTKAAVEAFQGENGLEITGIVTIRDTTILFSDDAIPKDGTQGNIELASADSVAAFHYAEYDKYNSYASVNGLGNDLIIIDATISEYSSIQGVSYVIIEQDDGNKWIITTGYIGEEGIIDGTVYSGLEGRKIKVFCVYQGFSDVVSLPAADIMSYGGILDIDNKEFLCNSTAEILMNGDGIQKSDFLAYLPDELPDTEAGSEETEQSETDVEKETMEKEVLHEEAVHEDPQVVESVDLKTDSDDVDNNTNNSQIVEDKLSIVESRVGADEYTLRWQNNEAVAVAYKTADNKYCVFIKNTSDHKIGEIDVTIYYYDERGNIIDYQKDGHDAVLPGYTVVSGIKIPKGYASASLELEVAAEDHPAYQNHSQYVDISANEGIDAIIVQITNNSDTITIREIEYDFVYFVGDKIASIGNPKDVYDTKPNGKAIEKEFPPKAYDDYMVFLNQAHTFS